MRVRTPQNGALVQRTGDAAAAPSEVSDVLVQTGKQNADAENGLLFNVLLNAMSMFSRTNGFGTEVAWDADEDVVLSLAFKSSSTQQVWVDFGLKLADVGNELSETTVEESKLLGRVKKVFAMFCDMNDMTDFNKKIAVEPQFGKETVTVQVGLKGSPYLPLELKQDTYYSQLRA